MLAAAACCNFSVFTRIDHHDGGDHSKMNFMNVKALRIKFKKLIERHNYDTETDGAK